MYRQATIKLFYFHYATEDLVINQTVIALSVQVHIINLTDLLINCNVF